MLLTKTQQNRFWREWQQVCADQGWTKAQSWTGDAIDKERKALLERAGFTSLTLVDPDKGFTRLLEQLAILRNDLTGLRRAEDNPKRQHIRAIQALSPHPNYWRAITRNRWKTEDLESLTLEQLKQLRYTLSSRNRPTVRLKPKPDPDLEPF